uniref:Uncharacterized protein n=1 Tax=Pavo cristatus TaxID=9049 RepID=A0A8C9FZZ2_PAVCR
MIFRISSTGFLLLAFTDMRELQLLHFWLSLGIYLAALLGNGLVITAIVCDHHLHTPMYFFLLNLALCRLGSISTTPPKAVANFLWDTRCCQWLLVQMEAGDEWCPPGVHLGTGALQHLYQ